MSPRAGSGPPRGRGGAPRPTLGVVVPALDEERDLPRLLRRLAEADGPERVVVVDGDSADATRALARELGAEVLAAARGRGTQLAAGARALDTELLLFLHADCVPEPAALDAVRAAFADPALDAAALRQRIDAPGRFYRMVERAAERRTRRGGWSYGDAGLAVRASVYRAVGGYRDLPLLEDLDLTRRLRAAGHPVRLVADAFLRVSPRRWESEGRLRATVRNRMLVWAYRAGLPPGALARFYPHRRYQATP